MNKSYINDKGFEVPDKTIAVIFNDLQATKEDYEDFIEPLAGQPKRDWWNPHFYYCLPINIGNQYGYAIKSLWDFDAVWDGSSQNDNDITITMKSKDYDPMKQLISGGFSEGVLI
jgi:hypothetical protein